MRVLVRLLLLAGAVSAALVIWSMHGTLFVFTGRYTEETTIALVLLAIPLALSLGGAAGARWLARRGSGWAVPVAGIPLAILLTGLALSLYFWLHPISFDHH